MPQAKAETPKRTSRRKVRQGVVVSDKNDKTLVVLVERTVRHPIYGKVMRRSERFHAHDEQNTGKVGDVVRIMGMPAHEPPEALAAGGSGDPGGGRRLSGQSIRTSH